MSTVARNKESARNYIDAITRGDSVTMLGYIADTAAIITMGSTLASGVRDKEALGKLLQDLKVSLPQGLKMTIHNVIGEGDRVALEAESSGPHISGKMYNNKYHFVFRFQNGKIVELKEYMDTEHVTDVLCEGKRRQG
jgi:ketosteroid isomerase-like protein